MDETASIGRTLHLPTTTSSSFDRDLRALLWSRTLLTMWIGLGISLVVTFIYRFTLDKSVFIQTRITDIVDISIWGHTLSFALGLVVCYILRENACIKISFSIISFNIVLAIFSHLFYNPVEPDYLALSLLLFLPAAFYPWKVYHQAGLAIITLLSYVITQFWVHHSLPEIQEFWNAQPESNSFESAFIMGSVGILILGLVSIAMSRTLYTLNRTVHQVKHLGNYIIDRQLGSGGMGTVYLARHALLCRPTAVKVMNSSEEGTPQSGIQRFEREVQLSAGLTHPNTISIFDFGHTPDAIFYYAMEYLPGLDLETLVRRFGPLEPERTAFILEQVAGSLSEAHNKGILHRDIKPSNIFLTQRGGLFDFVKVLDFGLAKQVQTESDPQLSRTGIILGTPRYIAPEALQENNPVDARADLYNLGGVVYWMLTGQPPFAAKSNVDLIIQHVQATPPRPSELSELEIPGDLEDMVMKLLEKNPSDRYASAEALSDAIKQLNLPKPWNHRRAAEWWQLHGLIKDEEWECPAR